MKTQQELDVEQDKELVRRIQEIQRNGGFKIAPLLEFYKK